MKHVDIVGLEERRLLLNSQGMFFHGNLDGGVSRPNGPQLAAAAAADSRIEVEACPS